MVYGPVDLGTATFAQLQFDLYLDSEANADFIAWGASTNGNNFHGFQLSGSNDWETQTFDLTNVPTLGNIAGQTQVWIAFIFRSDSNFDAYHSGPWLDNIVLRASGAAPDFLSYLPFVSRSRSPAPISTPTATPQPPTPSPTGDLRITDLQYSGNDEYVKITNHGTDSQSMRDWTILSVVGSQTYRFPPPYILEAGASVRIHSGPDAVNHDNPPNDLVWTRENMWNNDGDKAELYDSAGKLIDSRCYGGGCP